MAVAKHNSLTVTSTNCVRPNISGRKITTLFNGDKFELSNFGKSARTLHYETPQRKQNEVKQSVRDPGISFEPNGKFNQHITGVVAKGNRMVRWILRTFRTRTKEVMLTLPKTLGVPQAEYGCIIWMPTSQNSVNLIESIQRRFY